jgi:5'-nucleotidase
MGEAFFMRGVPKTKTIEAFRPCIFFDDQETHCDPASGQAPCLETLATIVGRLGEVALPRIAADMDHCQALQEAESCHLN